MSKKHSLVSEEQSEIEKNSNSSDTWFTFRPREIDLLYAVWNGENLASAMKDLGLSSAASSVMISNPSLQHELAKYFRAMTISKEEHFARLSQFVQTVPLELH